MIVALQFYAKKKMNIHQSNCNDFPDRQKKLVSAWAVLHKDELLANWELAREDQSLFRIDPLR